MLVNSTAQSVFPLFNSVFCCQISCLISYETWMAWDPLKHDGMPITLVLSGLLIYTVGSPVVGLLGMVRDYPKRAPPALLVQSLFGPLSVCWLLSCWLYSAVTQDTLLRYRLCNYCLTRCWFVSCWPTGYSLRSPKRCALPSQLRGLDFTRYGDNQQRDAFFISRVRIFNITCAIIGPIVVGLLGMVYNHVEGFIMLHRSHNYWSTTDLLTVLLLIC